MTALRRGDNWQPATGEIIVTTPDPLAGTILLPASRWKFPASSPGRRRRWPTDLFDYRDYLQTRGIYYQLKTESTNDWQLREPISSQPPLTDRFLSWAKKTLALGLPAEDEPLRLLWAMTLGWRTAFTGDISEPFLRAGTMHLFAIDGLRIALMSGMIVTLLRVLRLSRGWCGLLAIPTIWFYTAATGWEPSAIRASVMMTVVLGGWALKRPGDTVNSLAAAAFIILLWEPRQLFEASFQLSFFVVLVIALMLPPLEQNVRPAVAARSAVAQRTAAALASRFDSNFADVPAVLRAFICGLGRLHSAGGEIFSLVQPDLDAGQHRCRAARHAGAHGQSRRARVRDLAAVGRRCCSTTPRGSSWWR